MESYTNGTGTGNSSSSQIFEVDLTEGGVELGTVLREAAFVQSNIRPMPPWHVLCFRKAQTFRKDCSQHSQFQCSDGYCISVDALCNGRSDCDGGEDEAGCPQTRSEKNSNYFLCQEDDNWVPWSSYCDFVQDCPDGTDESNCTFPVCGEKEWQCKSQQCIPLEQRCNGMPYDCLDGSDENDCQRECHGFSCLAGTCIPCYFINDTQVDCPGSLMEDEGYSACGAGCSRWCDTKRDMSKSIHSSGNTIIKDWKVYHIDEYFCKISSETRCEAGFQRCFPREKACIYELDVHSKQVCPNQNHLEACSNFTCPGMFQCPAPNNYCIPLHSVCDGIHDCPGASDEAECTRLTCKGQLRCVKAMGGPRICLDQERVCDGHPDCLNDIDEKYCDATDCPVGCSCLGYSVRCTSPIHVNLRVLSRNTRALWLDGNVKLRISPYMFSNFSYLGNLGMRSMGISLIPDGTFYGLQNLVRLDLSLNKIKYILANYFVGLKSLQVITLYGNPVTLFQRNAFNGLWSLKLLDLSNLSLAELPSDGFVGAPNITKLNISHNELKIIQNNAFRGLGHLTYIDLRFNSHELRLVGNALKSVDVETLYTDDYKYCCAARQVKTCFPLPDAFSNCDDLLANGAQRVFVWILGVLAVIGNIAVFVWRVHSGEWRRIASSVFIINLSIADFLMGIYLIIIGSSDVYYRGQYILFADDWKNHHMCRLAGVLSFVSSQASVTLLGFITLDRLICIVFHFSVPKMSIKHSAWMTIATWFFWITCALGPIIATGSITKKFYGKNSVCLPYVLHDRSSGDNLVSVFMLLLFNLICFLFMVGSYVAIVLHTRRSRRSSQRQVMNSDYLLARRLTILIGTNFACWIPIIAVSIFSYAGMTINSEVSSWIAVFVLPINSSLNPYLYTASTANPCHRSPTRERRDTTRPSTSSRLSAISLSVIANAAVDHFPSILRPRKRQTGSTVTAVSTLTLDSNL